MKSVRLFEPKVIHWFFGLAPILILLSCAHQKMYTGPNLRAEQTAILEATVPIWIVSIDGEKVSSLSLHDSTSVKLLPGSHVVEVAFQQVGIQHVMKNGFPRLERSRKYGDSTLKLKMLAEAGCRYYVDYRLEVDGGAKKKIWKVQIVKLQMA